ncbi:MAG: hypothetical protein AAGH78_16180, partial [Cyanobacteria bacterium P01_H01_bin.58]
MALGLWIPVCPQLIIDSLPAKGRRSPLTLDTLGLMLVCDLFLAMAADSIQKTNVAWQLRHLGKNASEWIQLQLSRGEPTAPSEPPPTFEWPAWIGNVVFWVAIAAGVVWLAWVIVQLIDRYRASRQAQNPQQPQIETINSMPERTAAAWLREAQALERQGNWRAACRAFYLAALQVLHDREWVPHL